MPAVFGDPYPELWSPGDNGKSHLVHLLQKWQKQKKRQRIGGSLADKVKGGTYLAAQWGGLTETEKDHIKKYRKKLEI